MKLIQSQEICTRSLILAFKAELAEQQPRQERHTIHESTIKHSGKKRELKCVMRAYKEKNEIFK